METRARKNVETLKLKAKLSEYEPVKKSDSKVKGKNSTVYLRNKANDAVFDDSGNFSAFSDASQNFSEISTAHISSFRNKSTLKAEKTPVVQKKKSIRSFTIEEQAGDKENVIDNSASKITALKGSKVPMTKKRISKKKASAKKGIQERDGSYEDDFFESEKFDYPKLLKLHILSDSSTSNFSTPKFESVPLTPMLSKRKSLKYKDVISPTEFSQAKRCAMEYLFRRNSKRQLDATNEGGSSIDLSEVLNDESLPAEKKLDF